METGGGTSAASTPGNKNARARARPLCPLAAHAAPLPPPTDPPTTPHTPKVHLNTPAPFCDFSRSLHALYMPSMTEGSVLDVTYDTMDEGMLPRGSSTAV